MSSYKRSLKQLFDDLDSGEKYLRNRRMTTEADAVKFARGVLLEEAFDAVRKSEHWEKEIDLGDISAN